MALEWLLLKETQNGVGMIARSFKGSAHTGPATPAQLASELPNFEKG